MNSTKRKKHLRELIVLAIVLLAGMAWLMLRPKGDVNYKLPELSPLSIDDISSISWRQGNDGEETKLQKKDGKWLLSDKEYPTSAGRFDLLLKQLASPSLADLVSTKGPYNKYNLDDKRKFLLQANNGEVISRSFFIGKNNNNSSYNYIAFPSSPEVYLLRANLAEVLSSKIEDLRDKLVFSFAAATITSLSIEGPEKSLLLSKTVKEGAEGEDNTDVWLDETGKEQESELLTTTLSKLSALNATGFSDKDLGESVFTITLTDNNNSSYTLKVAEQPLNEDEGDGYLATSSSYGFPFILSSYTIGSFLEDFGLVEKTEDK